MLLCSDLLLNTDTKLNPVLCKVGSFLDNFSPLLKWHRISISYTNAQVFGVSCMKLIILKFSNPWYIGLQGTGWQASGEGGGRELKAKLLKTSIAWIMWVPVPLPGFIQKLHHVIDVMAGFPAFPSSPSFSWWLLGKEEEGWEVPQMIHGE